MDFITTKNSTDTTVGISQSNTDTGSGVATTLTTQQLTTAPTLFTNMSSNNGLYHAHTNPTGFRCWHISSWIKIMHHLNEHINNLLSSEVVPRIANGDKMQSLGEMLIKFSLEGREHCEDIYIYPYRWYSTQALSKANPTSINDYSKEALQANKHTYYKFCRCATHSDWR